MDAHDETVAVRRKARNTLVLAGGFAILAALVVAGGAGPAEAAFPGENGEIAFSKFSTRTGEVRIATVNPDGTGQARLGDGTGYWPSYSADGQKVAFVRGSGATEEDYNEDIWVMDSDGNNPVRLTTGRGFETAPSFSPDGQTVAFVRYGNRGSEIYTKRLDGTGVTRLTDTPATYEESPVYSPDGQKISFAAFGRRGSDVRVMNADGTGAQNLTRTRDIDEADPDWSPDGTKIAFTSYRFSFSASRSSGPATVASQLEQLMEDGSRVDAQGEPGQVQEEVEISVMNADGTSRENITESPDYDVAPAFSPDGTKIAFTRASISRREGETAEILVMNADGTGEQQLTDTRAVEFRPDWQPLTQTP